MSWYQCLTDDGMVALLRNCYLPKQEILTVIGPVSVHILKVRSKDWKVFTFCSSLIPPYVRKTRSLEAALLRLYLKDVSTREIWEEHQKSWFVLMLRVSQPVPSHALRVNGRINISIGGGHLLIKVTGSISVQMASIQVFDP